MIVGQHRDGIEGLVGDQVRTGRTMQIQTAEHLAEALFLGPLEPVPPSKTPARTVFLSRLTDDIGVAPHQIAFLLPPQGVANFCAPWHSPP